MQEAALPSGLASGPAALIIWPLKYMHTPVRSFAPVAQSPSSVSGYPVMATPGSEEERAPRWHRRPDERRAAILHRAVLAFSKNGYERAPLADVAEHAGVCAGTVSHYFGSKAKLFEDVIA